MDEANPQTAARVAAGGVAREAIKALCPGLTIRGAMVQMGLHQVDRANWDWDEVENNPFWTGDPKAAEDWAVYLDGLRKSGSSIGAVVEVVASGTPAGLGAPIYGKIDQDLASAMMSINAVKGVEIGAGMGAAAQDIVCRFAVKPTSSILTPRATVTKSGEDTEIVTKGRHDPCVGIRAVPVGEAMMACVILDHLLLHRGQIG